ncbi:MAG: hypothetical protein JWN24_1432 [Phycisphaerales bacterium]|jgi:hypothetical protein|nr:hypothetical protein [Phycisphaerales bacterium]
MRWFVLLMFVALLAGCDKKIHEAGLRAPTPMELAHR